jgi:exopolysaccharide biosynthesis polyprenyl glycosylphosphotransferase
MLRERVRLVRFTLATIDALLIVACFSADPLRAWAWSLPAEPTLLPRTLLLIPLLPAWVCLLSFFGLYRAQRTASIGHEMLGVAKAAAMMGLLMAALVVAFRGLQVQPSFVIAFCLAAFVLTSLGRASIRIVARQFRVRGYKYRNIVVVVGSTAKALECLELVRQNRHWGLKLVGTIDAGGGPLPAPWPTHLGSVADLGSLAAREVIDEVIFAALPEQLGAMRDAITLCETVGIRAHIALDIAPLVVARLYRDELAGMPLLTFSTTPHAAVPLIVKRAVDVTLAGALLAVLSPLFLIAAIAVRVTSGGPVLFHQIRVGLNGRRFRLYKFRSMVHDAEHRRHEVAALNQLNGPIFKVADDPRLVPVGRWLRRTSVDELPQLFNVLRGEMSLVGPRPPVPEEVRAYRPADRRRLSMKPGLTCLWQVNGRDLVTDFDRRLELDLHYIDNWSLGLDFRILAQTIPVVLRGRGAA